MENVEKNILLGAFATGAVDAGIESYYAYYDGLGQPPRDQFPYQEIHPALPPVDNWISLAGFPLLLYLLGKGMKNEKLVQIAKGGGIYGVSGLIGETVFRTVGLMQRPAARYVVVR